MSNSNFMPTQQHIQGAFVCMESLALLDIQHDRISAQTMFDEATSAAAKLTRDGHPTNAVIILGNLLSEMENAVGRIILMAALALAFGLEPDEQARSRAASMYAAASAQVAARNNEGVGHVESGDI